MSKIFTIRWTQTLQEDFEVEAETEEEAIQRVSNGECGDVDMIADNEFTVVNVEEAEVPDREELAARDNTE